MQTVYLGLDQPGDAQPALRAAVRATAPQVRVLAEVGAVRDPSVGR
jgi:hypothetical protein